MPKSLASTIEELVEKVKPSKDAPTRFDLYDLERLISDIMPDNRGLENKIDDLSNQIETLSKAVENLAEAIEKLCEKGDDK